MFHSLDTYQLQVSKKRPSVFYYYYFQVFYSSFEHLSFYSSISIESIEIFCFSLFKIFTCSIKKETLALSLHPTFTGEAIVHVQLYMFLDRHPPPRGQVGIPPPLCHMAHSPLGLRQRAWGARREPLLDPHCVQVTFL